MLACIFSITGTLQDRDTFPWQTVPAATLLSCLFQLQRAKSFSHVWSNWILKVTFIRRECQTYFRSKNALTYSSTAPFVLLLSNSPTRSLEGGLFVCFKIICGIFGFVAQLWGIQLYRFQVKFLWKYHQLLLQVPLQWYCTNLLPD